MDLKAFLEEHKRLMKTLAVGTRLERHQEFKKQYKEMKAKLEAAKTPEQKQAEDAEMQAKRAKMMEKLALIRAKKAEKVEAEKAQATKTAAIKSGAIQTAWTAYVKSKGSVKAAVAAKKADNEAYLAYAAKWKKENPK